ncbi:MAG: maleylpyruvate isomerase family mycothiol-dependent enzyme [Acidimicrobiales bacterium]
MAETTTVVEQWRFVAAERQALVDFARTLTEEQLAAPSLCDGWQVRDVLGHVAWVAVTPPIEVAREMLFGGLHIHQVIADQGRVYGSLDTETLLERLAAGVGSQFTSPTITPASLLADTIVHHQDIRRALDLPRIIDPAPLRVALDRYTGVNSFTGGKKRTRGLRLIAIDVGWSHGSGPEVHGTGEAILLASVGRAAALADLTGPGVEILASRG